VQTTGRSRDAYSPEKYQGQMMLLEFVPVSQLVSYGLGFGLAVNQRQPSVPAGLLVSPLAPHLFHRASTEFSAYNHDIES
jgi:hypothetical protein